MIEHSSIRVNQNLSKFNIKNLKKTAFKRLFFGVWVILAEVSVTEGALSLGMEQLIAATGAEDTCWRRRLWAFLSGTLGGEALF